MCLATSLFRSSTCVKMLQRLVLIEHRFATKVHDSSLLLHKAQVFGDALVEAARLNMLLKNGGHSPRPGRVFAGEYEPLHIGAWSVRLQALSRSVLYAPCHFCKRNGFSYGFTGTMTFGEQNSYSDAAELLDIAKESGINFFDSAEMYPVPQSCETYGRSELYLGRWIKDHKIARDKVVVATKVAGPSGQMTWIRGGPHSLDKKNIRDAIDGSLQRLSLDYIDLYQIHWPDRYVPMFGDVDYDPTYSYAATPIEEQLEALSDAITSGKVRYVGLSNETPYGVTEFCRISRQNKHLPRVVSIQNAYNLLCRSFDSGLAECCHHERIALLAYSPLAMGLLTGKYLEPNRGPPDARLNLYRGRYAEAECRYDFTKPNLIPAVEAYVEISKRHRITPAALAIGFVLRHPLVASVVIGATKASQLRELITAASKITVTDQILEEINRVHRRYPNPAP